MSRFSDPQARELLSGWSVDRPVLVGEGMEGAVYSLDPTRVAKIWFSRSASAVLAAKPFFDALAAKGLSFATPQILEVREAGGFTVSCERRLLGTPMSEALLTGAISRAEAHRSFVAVVGELAGSGPCPAARSLPVMDASEPFWASGDTFGTAMAALAERRRRRYQGVLAKAVDDFDRLADALLERLPAVDSGVLVAIHGDLVPANLLVAPAAVLDWGFFSTEGDPVFEAAVAAALFDMYSDDALDNELALYEQIEDALGYSRESLLVYRAAYSLITAAAFDEDGNDGHFAWCARALNRADVRSAVLT